MTVLLASVTWSYGQITRNEYRMNRGYLRLGLNNFGEGTLDANVPMLDNMLDGRYGAKSGYVLEFGRNYYFNRTSLLPLFDTKVGLDWTQLSLTYNELDWSTFIERDRAAGYEVDVTSFFAASASSKIGPVISVNFIGKLVLDVRAQLAATYFANGVDYYAYTDDDDRYMTFMPEDGEGDDSEEEGGVDLAAFGKLGKFGFKQTYGATVRYGPIGVAVDYFPGSFKYEYETSEGDGDVKAGTEKFKNNMFQIKLSLTL